MKPKGSTRATRRLPTQREALAVAQEFARRQGTQVVLHGRDGKPKKTYDYRKAPKAKGATSNRKTSTRRTAASPKRPKASPKRITIAAALKDLKKKDEPVPKPPSLPSPRQVSRAEKRLKMTFPPQYTKFLLEASNVTVGTIEPATLSGKGADDLVGLAKEAWKQSGVPRELLPFAYDNGDYYCLDASGRVLHWYHDSRQVERTWPSFAAWIKRVWLKSR